MKRQRSEEEGGDVEEPSPKRIMADPMSWEALEARFSVDINKVNAVERDVDITFAESVHKYAYRDQIMRISVTEAVSYFKEVFIFETAVERVSKALEKPSYSGPHRGRTQEQARGHMTGASGRGTALHDLYDRFISGRLPRLSDDEKSKVPLSFRRVWADYPTLVPRRTEWSVIDEVAGIGGRLDLTATLDGVSIMPDYKNWGYMSAVMGPVTEKAYMDAGILAKPRFFSGAADVEARLKAEEVELAQAERGLRAEKARLRRAHNAENEKRAKTGLPPLPLPDAAEEADPPAKATRYHAASRDRAPRKCPHPLVSHLPDGKLTSAWLQVNMYADIIERTCPDYVKRFGRFERFWIISFPPEFPDHYELFEVTRAPESMMRALFALFPWNPRDPRHFARDPARDFCVTELIAPIPGEEYMGPTRVAPITLAEAREDPDALWVGAEYKPTKPAQQERYGMLPATVWSPKAFYRAPPKIVRDHKDAQRARTYGGGNVETTPRDGDLKRALADYTKALTVSARQYEAWLVTNRLRLYELMASLYGKTLLCWCSPDDPIEWPYCHARILARYANAIGDGRAAIIPDEIEEVPAMEPTSSPFR